MNNKETVEEAAENYAEENAQDENISYHNLFAPLEYAFLNGAKWQAKIMYSEDDIKPLIDFIKDCYSNWDCDYDAHKYNTVCRVCKAQKLLEEFKKN